MTQDWSVPGWAVLAAAGVLVLSFVVLGALRRAARRRVVAQMAQTQHAAQALAEQVARLEARLAGLAEKTTAPTKTSREVRADYVITRMGDADDEPNREGQYAPLHRAVFADLLLRETAVRVAGLGAGLRRALAPETRNRIRFEMKQEVKRSRKQRKADLRVAHREWEARQRSTDSLSPDATERRTA